MVNHSYIIVSIVYLYRQEPLHLDTFCLYGLIYVYVFLLCVLYMCILSFVCLYYAFMYVTLLVGGNKEYLLTQGHSLLRPMSMLMLMFNFLKVSLKYGSTGAHSHTLRYYYFPYTYWVMYVTQLYLRKVIV